MYAFSLTDNLSAPLRTVTVATDRALELFSKLEKQTTSLQERLTATGETVGYLKDKMDLLKEERALLDITDTEAIQVYNKKIEELETQIAKLESTASSSTRFSKWNQQMLKDMVSIKKLGNPYEKVLKYAVKAGMGLDEGLAQIRVTTRLDEEGMENVRTQLREMAQSNQADILTLPGGFEKIYTQVKDVDLSMQVLEASLKGSKASFTELDTVAGIVAETLAAAGKESTSAATVMDTMLVASRIGGSGIKEMGQKMPDIIKSATKLGVGFQEAAGAFAYMTSKGDDVQKTASQLQAALEALGKADVQESLEGAGLQLKDEEGNLRSLLAILQNIETVTSKLSRQEQISFFSDLGIPDAEAVSAFSVMTQDLEGLKTAFNEVRNSSGETQAALALSANAVQKSTGIWNTFKNTGAQLGQTLMPIIELALILGEVIGSGLYTAVANVCSIVDHWFGLLQAGDPVIIGCASALAFLAIAYNRATIAAKIKSTWDDILAVKGRVLTTVQNVLNATLMKCPLVWIAALLGLVIAAVVSCWHKFEGFRMVILGIWEVVKVFGGALVNSIISPIKKILSGLGGLLGAIAEVIRGNFKEAKVAALQGAKDLGAGLATLNPIGIGYNMYQNTKNVDWKDTYNQGAEKGRNKPEPGEGGSAMDNDFELGDINEGALDRLKSTQNFNIDLSGIRNQMSNGLPEGLMDSGVNLPTGMDALPVHTGNGNSPFPAIDSDLDISHPATPVLDLNIPSAIQEGSPEYLAAMDKLATVQIQTTVPARQAERAVYGAEQDPVMRTGTTSPAGGYGNKALVSSGVMPDYDSVSSRQTAPVMAGMEDAPRDYNRERNIATQARIVGDAVSGTREKLNRIFGKKKKQQPEPIASEEWLQLPEAVETVETNNHYLSAMDKMELVQTSTGLAGDDTLISSPKTESDLTEIATASGDDKTERQASAKGRLLHEAIHGNLDKTEKVFGKEEIEKRSQVIVADSLLQTSETLRATEVNGNYLSVMNKTENIHTKAGFIGDSGQVSSRKPAPEMAGVADAPGNYNKERQLSTKGKILEDAIHASQNKTDQIFSKKEKETDTVTDTLMQTVDKEATTANSIPFAIVPHQPELTVGNHPTTAGSERHIEDIMLNVRKIAAAAAIPFLLALPGQAAGELKTPKDEMYAMEQPASLLAPGEEDLPGSEEMNPSGRQIYIDRVCDQIVIHVANTDGQGTETIRYEIMKVLNEICAYEG